MTGPRTKKVGEISKPTGKSISDRSPLQYDGPKYKGEHSGERFTSDIDYMKKKKLEMDLFMHKDYQKYIGPKSERDELFEKHLANMKNMHDKSEHEGKHSGDWYKWNYYVQKYGDNNPVNLANILADNEMLKSELDVLNEDIVKGETAARGDV